VRKVLIDANQFPTLSSMFFKGYLMYPLTEEWYTQDFEHFAKAIQKQLQLGNHLLGFWTRYEKQGQIVMSKKEEEEQQQQKSTDCDVVESTSDVLSALSSVDPATSLNQLKKGYKRDREIAVEKQQQQKVGTDDHSGACIETETEGEIKEEEEEEEQQCPSLLWVFILPLLGECKSSQLQLKSPPFFFFFVLFCFVLSFVVEYDVLMLENNTNEVKMKKLKNSRWCMLRKQDFLSPLTLTASRVIQHRQKIKRGDEEEEEGGDTSKQHLNSEQEEQEEEEEEDLSAYRLMDYNQLKRELKNHFHLRQKRGVLLAELVPVYKSQIAKSENQEEDHDGIWMEVTRGFVVSRSWPTNPPYLPEKNSKKSAY